MGKLIPLRAAATVLAVLLFATGLAAQELSVRNRPYKGEIRGRGSEMTVRLDQIATALGLPTEKNSSGWTLGGVVITTVEDAGAVYVKLVDLSVTGAKVTHNKELNTIDVNRPVAKINEVVVPERKRTAAAPPTSSGWVMVHWGASW